MSAAQKTKSRNFAGRPLTEEEVDRILENSRLKHLAVVVLAAMFGLGMLSLMMTPLAKTIAGTTTEFSVQISFAFNMALGLTAVGATGGCYGLNKARRHHKARARRLEVQLTEAKKLRAPA